MSAAGTPHSSSVRALLLECLVQIGPDQETEGGSGFFAAPGFVVTCAHVTRRAAGQAVTGLWRGREWSGTVAFTSSPPAPGDPGDPGNPGGTGGTGGTGDYEDPGLWPLPDLAVIRLDPPFPHPCVRLASREPDHDDPEHAEPMLAVGRFAALDEGPGDYATGPLHYSLMYQGRMLLRGEGFGSGMSGGPVLDQRTGDVCGVLKTAGADREGYAVPVLSLRDDLPPELSDAMMRGHDAYHSGNEDWPRAQEPLWQRLAARTPDGRALVPVLQPLEEARLLGLLTRFPDVSPSTLNTLYREAANGRELMVRDEVGKAHDEPRAFRDLVTRLGDHCYEEDEVHPVVRFAELAADWQARTATPGPAPDSDSGTGAELREWATLTAHRQGTLPKLIDWRRDNARRKADPEPRPGPESLIVQLDPSYHASAEFTIKVSSYRDGVNTVEEAEDTCRPREEALEAARAALAREARKYGNRALMIEFVVPPWLFDEPFDLWQVHYPRAAWSGLEPGQTPPPESLRTKVRLGYRHPVVIRDLERFTDPASREHAVPRWDELLRCDGVPLTWLRCDEPRDADIYRRFEADPAAAAVGMTWPASEDPGSTWLYDAIDAGVPLAIWRRYPCAGCGGPPPGACGCQGTTFANAIDSIISRTALLDVPEMIRRIRSDPMADPAVEDSLVLLWDDPRRGSWDN